MLAPATYSEWVILLEQFGQGNDASLEKLSAGTFIVDAGMATRFYFRVEEAYKKRKQNWLDKFQRSFQSQPLKTMGDVEIILRNGKQNLSPLIVFTDLKGLPEDLRKMLRKDLEEFVLEIKTSLKDKVSKLSNEKEKMMLLLNSFVINDIAEKTRTANKIETIPPGGRKIIF